VFISLETVINLGMPIGTSQLALKLCLPDLFISEVFKVITIMCSSTANCQAATGESCVI